MIYILISNLNKSSCKNNTWKYNKSEYGKVSTNLEKVHKKLFSNYKIKIYILTINKFKLYIFNK